MLKGMRRLLAVGAVLVGLTGCHSAFVAATIQNRTGKAISLVELDYPSASFGAETLAAGQDFHYRFKVLGSGGVKLLWTDAARVDRHADGPELVEGDEGTLTVTITDGGVKWVPVVRKK